MRAPSDIGPSAPRPISPVEREIVHGVAGPRLKTFEPLVRPSFARVCDFRRPVGLEGLHYPPPPRTPPTGGHSGGVLGLAAHMPPTVVTGSASALQSNGAPNFFAWRVWARRRLLEGIQSSSTARSSRDTRRSHRASTDSMVSCAQREGTQSSDARKNEACSRRRILYPRGALPLPTPYNERFRTHVGAKALHVPLANWLRVRRSVTPAICMRSAHGHVCAEHSATHALDSRCRVRPTPITMCVSSNSQMQLVQGRECTKLNTHMRFMHAHVSTIIPR